MFARLSLGALALGAAAMIQCDLSNNPSSPGVHSPGSAYVPIKEMRYMLPAANYLTTISTSTQCNGSVLETSTDTSTDRYIVTAESLYVFDTSSTSGDTFVGAQRRGSGSGLIGTWVMTSEEMTGTPVEMLYVISATTIQAWIPKAALIAAFKAGMFSSDSSGNPFPGITIDTTAADRILFTGTTTNEVVTVTVANDGAFRWSSSNSAHATQEINMFAEPTACPDNSLEGMPTWFTEFLLANMTIPKMRALPGVHLKLEIFGR